MVQSALGALIGLWQDVFRVPPPNVGHTVVSTGMCESIVEKGFGDLDSKGWCRSKLLRVRTAHVHGLALRARMRTYLAAGSRWVVLVPVAV